MTHLLGWCYMIYIYIFIFYLYICSSLACHIDVSSRSLCHDHAGLCWHSKWLRNEKGSTEMLLGLQNEWCRKVPSASDFLTMKSPEWQHQTGVAINRWYSRGICIKPSLASRDFKIFSDTSEFSTTKTFIPFCRMLWSICLWSCNRHATKAICQTHGDV